jgi:hypothetical protein
VHGLSARPASETSVLQCCNDRLGLRLDLFLQKNDAATIDDTGALAFLETLETGEVGVLRLTLATEAALGIKLSALKRWRRYRATNR